MHDDRAFLQAIRDHPEEDLHRMAWADWLEENGQDERAAFVRAQLRLAALGADDPATDPLLDESDDLLARHEAAWLGRVGELCLEWTWERGSIEQVTVWADTLLEHGEELFACAPIRGLRLFAAAEDLPRLAGCPFLGRVRALDLGVSPTSRAAQPGPLHRDRPLQGLLVSPHLEGLRDLRLAGQGIETPTIRTLVETGLFARLRRLDLTRAHAVGDTAARLLLGTRAPHLEELYLRGGNYTVAGLRGLLRSEVWPGLHTLEVDVQSLFLRSHKSEALSQEVLETPIGRRNTTLCLDSIPLGPEELAVLSHWEGVGNLRSLHLQGCRLDAGAMEQLAGANLDRLTRLELEGNQLQDQGARLLAGSPHLARVTRLGLANNGIGGPGLRALLDAPSLAGLLRLDLSGNYVGETGAESIASSERPRRLVQLELLNANLDAAAVRRLVSSPALKRLRVLRLGGNRLGDEGVAILAGSRHLARLRALSLDSNGVDSPGALALLESESLDRVTRLELRNAFISPLEREQLRARFGPGTAF